ncbi:uncharacterized protein [Centruroides vittatus]|uniref:uncharacterized protein n=1 Tax=Centruroides vittatus TaxID=120091 RepID=UPI00350F63DE
MNLWNLIATASVLIEISQERAISYEELISLNAQCGPFDTCNTTKENLEVPARSCQCDDSCAFYGDCCIDAPNRQAMERTETRNICLKKNNFQGYFAVSNCKKNWRDLETKRKCENPNAEDPYTLIPVASKRSKITYRNRYCASCNEDKRDIEFWKIGVTCRQLSANLSYDFPNDLVYNSRLKTWGVLLPNQTFLRCKLVPVSPENTQNLRSCYSDTISTCFANWKDDSIKEKCESYTAIILARHRVKYRNVHCAVCNGINVTDLNCPYLSSGELARINVEIPGTPNIVCLFSVGNCYCENKVYDTAFRKCRELTCGLPFLELKDGKCVHKS